MTPSFLRKLFLGVLIATDLLMLVCWWLAGQTVFFWVFIAINVCVLIGEVVNNVWGYKKSLSTEVTQTVEKGGSKAIFSYLGVVLLVLTMVALGFHLLVH